MPPRMINKNNYWSEEHKARLINIALRVQRQFKTQHIDLWDLIIEGWLKSARYRKHDFSSRSMRVAMIDYVWNYLIRTNGRSQIKMNLLGDFVFYIEDYKPMMYKVVGPRGEGKIQRVYESCPTEAEAYEFKEYVRRVISIVPDFTNRKLLVGYYLKGKTQKAMGARYGMNNANVNARMKYALNRIRERYHNYWSEGQLKENLNGL